MARVMTASPLTADDVAPTRRPVDEAHLLPPRAFHDPDVFAFEQEAWFATSWVCVGRDEEAAEPGQYFLATVAGDGVVVVRDRAGDLRGFHNVCRHRGSVLLTEPEGRLVRFQCPYHAWTYGLDGALIRAGHTDALIDFEPEEQSLHAIALTVWAGFIFVSLDPSGGSLADHLADLPGHVERFGMAGLRRARRIEYEVDANWKVIAENYSECYHCPGVHPQLNKLTPYDQGLNLESNGPWAGGWMELTGDADTMSVDGHTHGRAPLPGLSEDDQRRIYYFVLWPNLLLSLHPDYVMTHQVWPISPERSRVICEWLFAPDEMLRADFDPADAIDFWDLTNRQDWRVCELQQRGTRSRSYVPGRYSLMEDMVHAFDLMVADRYAGDGIVTRFEPRHDKWRDQSRPRGAAKS
ncbi:MAG: aromatic ring-hydroxylating dioxygenase subunit alpha [Candidatus Limnocylindrales bacterium]